MADRCPSCGVINPVGVRSCAACGRDLSVPPAPGEAWGEARSRAAVQNADAGSGGEATTAPVSGPRQLVEHFPGGQAASLVLTVGQVASILNCIIALVGIVTGLAAASHLRQLGGPETDAAVFFVVANGLLQALLSAAMFVVFHWVKALANAAAQQDAENRSLSQAVDSLRSGSDQESAPRAPDSGA